MPGRRPGPARPLRPSPAPHRWKAEPGGRRRCQRPPDRSGQKQEATEWHRVVLFGKTAEIASQYLTKGRQVYIEGRIRTRQWQDQSGQKRYTTEIIATNMTLLGGRSGAERAPEEVGATVPPDDPVAGEFGPGPDDDIPF